MSVYQMQISQKELCSIIQKKISGFVYFEDNIQKDPDQRLYCFK